MPPNLSVGLTPSGPVGAALDRADAVRDAYGARFGGDHPGTRWAGFVANAGRAILEVN